MEKSNQLNPVEREVDQGEVNEPCRNGGDGGRMDGC